MPAPTRKKSTRNHLLASEPLSACDKTDLAGPPSSSSSSDRPAYAA